MATGTGIRGAIREVTSRASAVMRLQAELFRTEMGASGKNAAAGAGVAVAAAFVLFFAFALLTTLFVVALAIVLPLWLSVLIVLVLYLLIAAVLGLVSRNRFQHVKGAPVAREQARLTGAALGKRQDEGAMLGAAPDVPGSAPPSPAARATTDGGDGAGA
jgi:hypothetical protein